MAAEKREKAEASLRFDEIEARMRDRLQAYLREFSQADIARRTGVRHQNVHRYLTNTRVPAAFCSVLIEDLDVNARWLMTGEGAPTATDIREDAQMKAGGLLELVDAMNAVGRMRLGTLLGNENLKVLRELGDALDRYEGIKRSLSSQARQTFEQVMDKFDQALTDRNITVARDLCVVAEQVGRLCDDEKLNARFDGIRSRAEYTAGNPDEALRYARRSHLRLMFDDERATSPEFYQNAFNYLIRLLMVCRFREGRNRAQAMLDLSEEIPGVAAMRDGLLALRAVFDIDLGAPGRAADTLLALYPVTMDDTIRDGFSSHVARAVLLSGRCDLSSAIGVGDDNLHKATELLRFAAWLEDADALKLLARRYIDKPERPYFTVSPTEDTFRARMKTSVVLRTRCMIAMIEDHDASLFPEWLVVNTQEKADADNSISGRLSYDIQRTQMLRLAGRLDEAREMLLVSAAALAAVGPEFTTNVLTRAIHHRNALELISKESRAQRDRELRAAAQTFFDESLAQGYGCFRKWASKPVHPRT